MQVFDCELKELCSKIFTLMKILLVLLFPIFVFGVVNPPYHKSQAPLLGGDTFRGYADYVFDDWDDSLRPETITPYSTIFVQTHKLDLFFAHIHPNIPCQYILITHNSDNSAPAPYTSYLEDEKIIVWFTANYDGYPHPKIHPIPFGIAWICLPWGDGEALKRVQSRNHKKTHLAYLNFTVDSFPSERGEVFHLFSNKPFCFRSERKPYEDFLVDLASSKFCISPRGAGLDTYRLWESLYLGVIPIVKSSSLDSLFADLPVLIVSDWKLVTRKFLKEKYKEFKSKTYNMEKIYSDYWFRLIDSYKKSISS